MGGLSSKLKKPLGIQRISGIPKKDARRSVEDVSEAVDYVRTYVFL